MLAQVTMLRYWKSEHDAETCEDAAGAITEQGLFAVADGAGTTLFADAWARFLVQFFLSVPLLSNDPFEVEWWVRAAQEQFKQAFPTPVDLSWNAQQKALGQGSYSTLATLRIFASDEARARANLLVFGDSCVFVHRPISEQTRSFPLQRPEEFERAPICIPSRAGLFNRAFHQSQVSTLDLLPSDEIVIATDAVAKWVLSAGNASYPDAGTALQELMRQTESSWPTFIRFCRTHQGMIDDDSTALIIQLFPDNASSAPTLGSTPQHSQEVREQRAQDFRRAYEEDNKERVAILFGDGEDLSSEISGIEPDTLRLAREVADAQREVLARLRQEINNPDVVALMTPVWQRYAHLLYAESCAANLRKTLTRLGVPLEPAPPAVIPVEDRATQPLAASIEMDEATTQRATEDIAQLETRFFDMREIQRRLQSDEPGEEG